MNSLDFEGLPLERLQHSRSMSNKQAKDPDLDYSKDGLNLLLDKGLAFDRSNSQCSTASRGKRVRVEDGSGTPRSKRQRLEPKVPKMPSVPESEMRGVEEKEDAVPPGGGTVSGD